jgi:hypothetical protein
MTLKQIAADRKRLAKAYNSLIFTRNITIDNFKKEFDRHVKLTCKKEDPHSSLIDSLSRSRNMKRLQKEMTETRGKMKQTQIESKTAKLLYKETQRFVIPQEFLYTGKKAFVQTIEFTAP